MTCDAYRNRLLAETDPTRPAKELRPHLSDCAGCREFADRYALLANDLMNLPVPSSELAKIAFAEQLASAGPIIRSVPSIAASGFSLKKLWMISAKPLAATAAAVAVGFGIYSLKSDRKPQPEYVAPRHELLRKVIATNNSLAKSSDPTARIAALSDLAADLRTETHDVVKSAPEEDLSALAGMYEEVVSKGLVNQANQLNPLTMKVATRVEVITAAADKLDSAANDADDLARNAPPHAQAPLKRIAGAATKGSAQLRAIARGEKI